MNQKVPEILLLVFTKDNFAAGAFELSENAKIHFVPAAEMIARSGFRVRIEGHCDTAGNENQNQKVSESRAIALKEYLKINGVTEERMTVRGNGSAVPVADERSEQGRSKNSWVEIYIDSRIGSVL